MNKGNLDRTSVGISITTTKLFWTWEHYPFFTFGILKLNTKGDMNKGNLNKERFTFDTKQPRVI